MKVRDDQGRFVDGARPSRSTEIKRGQRLSPRTEFHHGDRRGEATRFKAGGAAHNKLPVGSRTVRIEAGTGWPRNWIKVAEPNKWRPLAIVVWERANGRRLPRGYVVHHRDRDTLNDEPSNLEALTRREHLEEHRLDLIEAQHYPSSEVA